MKRRLITGTWRQSWIQCSGSTRCHQVLERCQLGPVYVTVFCDIGSFRFIDCMPRGLQLSTDIVVKYCTNCEMLSTLGVKAKMIQVWVCCTTRYQRISVMIHRTLCEHVTSSHFIVKLSLYPAVCFIIRRNVYMEDSFPMTSNDSRSSRNGLVDVSKNSPELDQLEKWKNCTELQWDSSKNQPMHVIVCTFSVRPRTFKKLA